MLSGLSPLRIPETFNFAQDVVYQRARLNPDAVATLALDATGRATPWTFSRIATRSRHLAAFLASAGLKRGERVLLLMDRTPDWQIAMTGCLHIGVIPVPCVTQVSADELSYRLKQSGATGVICEQKFTDRFVDVNRHGLVCISRGSTANWIDFEAVVNQTGPEVPLAVMRAEDPALMYFTSGSSGLPKAVVHAARSVFLRGKQPWRQLGVHEHDIIWTTSDTGWTRAASCLLFGAWSNGAVSILHESPPEPPARLDILAQYGVTIFGAVTTELRLIIANAQQRPLPQLRWTLSAGEVMTAEMAHRWKEFSGCSLLVGYGQSETTTATLTDPDKAPQNGMIGHSLSGNIVTIVNAEGVECAPNERGDIAFSIQDPGLMLGYWNAGAIQMPLRNKQWHIAGDVGYRDEEGALYFVGRDDDIISSSGYRIGPTEVENALMQHPSIAECAVVSSPDAVRGEVVKAFVVLKEGMQQDVALASELQDFVKQTIAPYKYPRKIEFVKTLPRTMSGKISRRLLRESEFNSTQSV